MTRIPVNGIHINVEVSGDGPPLLLLHGFTGSCDTWKPFLTDWQGRTNIAVDIVGHGKTDSPADPIRYHVEPCIDDLLAILDHLGVHSVVVLGYSMGGRVALRLALAAPERVTGLILESASPGIEKESDRVARLAADERLAEMIEREGLVAFINYWERIPLWASQASMPAAEAEALRRQRLQNNPVGLANSLRGMGAGHEASVLEQMTEIQVPTLLLAGSLDSKYSELSADMLKRLPAGNLVVVPGAGHAIHVEQPGVFGQTVKEFLASMATER